MATEKQISANRQNAQKSTGPKTDEGKAAVSQNAVKHGLFAQSVIFGENEADYEAFHDQMLAELDPIGAVETAMAERIINLWWRLKRAERMQNEVIEDLIGLFVTNKTSRSCRQYHLRDQGLRPDDPGFDLDGLALGRIASNDWSCTRILDRMLMYERRIESSVIKLTKELGKQQLMRRVEQRDISQDEAIAKTEALMGKKVNLKKQSQFVPDMMGISPYGQGCYDGYPLCGAQQNKAKQSQFDAPFGPESGPGAEQPPTAATG